MAKATTKKAMTKAQLSAHLAEVAGITKLQAKTVLEELAKQAVVQAKTIDKGFTIPGIGKLVLSKRKARTGRNPQTGEPMRIPAKKVVKFRIAKACKDAIIPPKA